MKAGATLTTDRLVLRHWRPEADGEVFHRLNSDERTMRFFPFRRDRAQSDALLTRIGEMIAQDGYGWCAFALRGEDKVIGFGGLARVHDLACAPATEIGWRLLPEYWRKGYASEAGSALLAHGFNDLGLDEIVSFAVHDNHASTGVMRRIGMVAEPDRDFDHPRVPDTHPELKRHAFYRITREQWLSRQAAG